VRQEELVIHLFSISHREITNISKVLDHLKFLGFDLLLLVSAYLYLKSLSQTQLAITSLMAERCQRIDEEVVASRDEISSLPDDLLIQILLLVPIKDAVGTMILSKRWRYVWTLLPKLEYSDPGDECESVWKFLEKLLELHKAPFLETLCIQLGKNFLLR